MDALKKWQVIITLFAVSLLVGCGAAGEEKVKKQLESKWAQLEAYEVQAKMIVQSVETITTYQLEVWLIL